MTDYEMIDLFLTFGSNLESMVERFIALLFAFLIASYLVSAKLRPLMVTIVVALYSYMALRYVFFYFNIFADQITLARQIVASQDQPGSSLRWLDAPPSTMLAIYYSQTVAMLLSYIASLVFFFYTRREFAKISDN